MAVCDGECISKKILFVAPPLTLALLLGPTPSPQAEILIKMARAEGRQVLAMLAMPMQAQRQVLAGGWRPPGAWHVGHVGYLFCMANMANIMRLRDLRGTVRKLRKTMRGGFVGSVGTLAIKFQSLYPILHTFHIMKYNNN